MFLFKNSRMKKTAHNNEFMKTCSSQIQGLVRIYGEKDENITKLLKELADDLYYTVPTSDPKAKSYEKSIEKNYDKLVALIKQPEWETEDIIGIINELKLCVLEINALRMTK